MQHTEVEERVEHGYRTSDIECCSSLLVSRIGAVGTRCDWLQAYRADRGSSRSSRTTDGWRRQVTRLQHVRASVLITDRSLTYQFREVLLSA